MSEVFDESERMPLSKRPKRSCANYGPAEERKEVISAADSVVDKDVRSEGSNPQRRCQSST